MTRLLTLIIVLAVSILDSGATAAESGTMADDLAQRDTAIHWPKEFDPSKAFVFSHNELLIKANCHRVWTQFADATNWPSWFVLTKDVTSDRGSKTIQHGTLLRLKIFGTPITARIDEFVADERLSWIPMTVEATKHVHYHTWHFVPETAGCRVVTEETGVGADDRKDTQSSSRFMHRAHDLWLASLRWKSEE